MNIAHYDWVVHGDWETLHAPTPELAVLFDGQDWPYEGYSLCGRLKEWTIPGVVTRMSVKRCRRCCRLLGYPQGVGSPKNDPAVMAVFGNVVGL